MDDTSSSTGFQTERDTRPSKATSTDKFANKSTIQPLNFFHHLHKAINKKNKLPSYFTIIARLLIRNGKKKDIPYKEERIIKEWKA